MAPGVMKKVICLFFPTFCINHTIRSPATTKIKLLVSSAKLCQRKLKIALKILKILPAIEGNASTTFPASHLRELSGLFNRFFKVPSSFGGTAQKLQSLFHGCS